VTRIIREDRKHCERVDTFWQGQWNFLSCVWIACRIGVRTNREIIEARSVSPEEIRSMPVTGPVAFYIRRRFFSA
jgi:hypothetical protein